jgi:hypothetical protein
MVVKKRPAAEGGSGSGRDGVGWKGADYLVGVTTGRGGAWKVAVPSSSNTRETPARSAQEASARAAAARIRSWIFMRVKGGRLI